MWGNLSCVICYRNWIFYFHLLSVAAQTFTTRVVESSWNVMAHGDTREGKWRGNWRMECVVGTLHTTSEHGVSIITTADAQTSAASSRLNWRPCRFKRTRPFRRKTKSGFCACAITFQTQSMWITSCRPALNFQDGSGCGSVFSFLWNCFLHLECLSKDRKRISAIKKKCSRVASRFTHFCKCWFLLMTYIKVYRSWMLKLLRASLHCSLLRALCYAWH